MRKIQPLFLSLAITVCLCSCKSEYTQRLSKGFELKKELIKLSNTSEVSNQLKVNEIRKELNLHAQVSGNEELFFKQLGLK